MDMFAYEQIQKTLCPNDPDVLYSYLRWRRKVRGVKPWHIVKHYNCLQHGAHWYTVHTNPYEYSVPIWVERFDYRNKTYYIYRV